jgi:hypothetical protein
VASAAVFSTASSAPGVFSILSSELLIGISDHDGI